MALDYAPTPWTKDGYDGWLDANCNPVRAYGVNIRSVMSGPSRRDRQTAEFMFHAVNMHSVMLAELREILSFALEERAPLREQEIASIRAVIAQAEGR